MPLILPGNVGSATAATGYDVANSCRFDYASSDYVHKTPGSAGSGTKFVFSTWIKRTKLATAMNIIYAQTATNNYERIRFVDTDKIEISGVANGSTAYNFSTNAVYRDPSAWMHLHVIRDSTQGTASNRLKVYVNGVLQTLAQDTALGENYSGLITGANVHRIAVGNGEPLGAYLAEVILLDGQVITPDGNTGEFDDDSGIWKPLDVSELTFGTTGFYLDFEASDNLGNDANGGDDFTEVNLDATNQSIDTCTNNFATWNSLQPTNAAMTEGNLIGASSASSGHYSGISTIGVSSGKWYFECKQTQESTANEGMIGVIIFYNTVTALLNPVGRGGGWGMQDGNRGFSTDSGGSGSTTDNFHAGWTDDDIIGIALDIDNSRVYYSKNGSWNDSGSWNASNPTTSQTLQNALGDGTYFFMAGDASGSNNNTWSANFGSPAFAISSSNTDGAGFGNFEYAVPSGYFALCTKNLAEYGG